MRRLLIALCALLLLSSDGRAFRKGIAPPYIGSDGWTVFTPQTGTSGTCGNSAGTYNGSCIIYVSQAGGSAGCSALPPPVTNTPTHWCTTIAAANAITRNAPRPDWLLFKKGEEWTSERIGVTSMSGQGPAQPAVISSYGASGARPKFSTSGSGTPCIQTIADLGTWTAYVGLECYSKTGDPSNPAYTGPTAVAGMPLSNSSNFTSTWIEDMKITYYSSGIELQNTVATPGAAINWYIRRNVIAFNAVGNGAYLFVPVEVQNTGTVLIEENVSDHNGWLLEAGIGANILAHNWYINHPARLITFKGNISARASSHGFQARTSTVATNNLLLQNAEGGFVNGATNFLPSTLSYNVVSQSGDIIVNELVASAPTAAGSAVLNFASVPSNVIAGLEVYNVTAGSTIPVSTVLSKTATTVTISANATGAGVSTSDVIRFYAARGRGLSVLNCGGYELAATVPINTSTLTFPVALPSSVVVGDQIFTSGNVYNLFPALTTVATIAADRLSITASANATAEIAGGVGQSAIQFKPIGNTDSLCPPQTAERNIISTQGGSRPTVEGQFALFIDTNAFSVNMSNNVMYIWNIGLTDNGTNSTKTSNTFNQTGSPVVAGATIADYDASIGGPGTIDHFLTMARAQSKDSWNPLYTADAANTYIRNSFGVPQP